MKTRQWHDAVRFAAICVAAICSGCQQPNVSQDHQSKNGGASDGWRNEFKVNRADLGVDGRNPYFELEPGHELVYESKHERVTITVLPTKRVVDGVTTRVVEEREEKNGRLAEVSRNYFAMDRRTGDVYYFGEEVDMYRDGQVTSHAGGWLAGANGATFGLMMPANPRVGDKFYEEHAPHHAMDRAEIVSVSETLRTPAGEFKNVIKVKETSPLEADVSYKWYAANIGLIRDDDCELIRLPSK